MESALRTTRQHIGDDGSDTCQALTSSVRITRKVLDYSNIENVKYKAKTAWIGDGSSGRDGADIYHINFVEN